MASRCSHITIKWSRIDNNEGAKRKRWKSLWLPTEQLTSLLLFSNSQAAYRQLLEDNDPVPEICSTVPSTKKEVSTIISPDFLAIWNTFKNGGISHV